MASAGCLALALYPWRVAPQFEGLLLLGGAALILLAAALISGEGLLVPWAIVALGCEFMVSLYLRNEAAPLTAAAYGTGLLLVAELASWSIELRLPARVEAHLGVRRIVAETILVTGSLAVGLLAASLAQTTIPGSLSLMAVGLGALIAALIIVATLVWRPRSNRQIESG